MAFIWGEVTPSTWHFQNPRCFYREMQFAGRAPRQAGWSWAGRQETKQLEDKFNTSAVSTRSAHTVTSSPAPAPVKPGVSWTLPQQLSFVKQDFLRCIRALIRSSCSGQVFLFKKPDWQIIPGFCPQVFKMVAPTNKGLTRRTMGFWTTSFSHSSKRLSEGVTHALLFHVVTLRHGNLVMAAFHWISFFTFNTCKLSDLIQAGSFESTPYRWAWTDSVTHLEKSLFRQCCSLPCFIDNSILHKCLGVVVAHFGLSDTRTNSLEHVSVIYCCSPGKQVLLYQTVTFQIIDLETCLALLTFQRVQSTPSDKGKARHLIPNPFQQEDFHSDDRQRGMMNQ